MVVLVTKTKKERKMQTSKGIPEEVKNQIIDGKKRVVTVVLPEKQKKAIEAKKKQKGQLAQKFFQISINVTKGQTVMQDIAKQMEGIDESINGRVKEGFKKLRLGKQKDRQWRFDNRDSFVGIYNPLPKKK